LGLAPLVAALLALAFELGAVFVVLFLFCLQLADLAAEFVDDFVDGDIEVGFGILGMDVRASESEVDLHGVGFFPIVVMEKNDMGPEDCFAVTFKVAHLFGHEFMDSAGEGDVTRSYMDLHEISVSLGGGRFQQI
jgi:hypothetical protein